MTVGERIKEARLAANMTQADLAERLGVAYQNIGQWESGKRNPKSDTIFKIAEALGVSWVWINCPEVMQEDVEMARKGYKDFLKYQRAHEHIEKIIEACFGEGTRKTHCITVDGHNLTAEYTLYPSEYRGRRSSFALFPDDVDAITNVATNLIESLVYNIAPTEEEAEKDCEGLLEAQKQYLREHSDGLKNNE